MAWTTPGTATAGEVLTASFWNAQVRDNFNASGRGFIGTTTIATSTAIATSYGTVGSSINCGTVAANRRFLITANATFVNTGTGTNVGLGLQFVAGGVTTNVDDIVAVPVTASGYNSIALSYLYTTSAGTLTVQLRAKKFDNVAVIFSNALGTYHPLTVIEIGEV